MAGSFSDVLDKLQANWIVPRMHTPAVSFQEVTRCANDVNGTFLR
jgi:hypothetical protein